MKLILHVLRKPVGWEGDPVQHRGNYMVRRKEHRHASKKFDIERVASCRVFRTCNFEFVDDEPFRRCGWRIEVQGNAAVVVEAEVTAPCEVGR
jgi:hypothetical protein